MTRVDAGGLEIREVYPVDVTLVDTDIQLMSDTPDCDTGGTASQGALFLCDGLEGASFEGTNYATSGSNDYRAIF